MPRTTSGQHGLGRHGPAHVRGADPVFPANVRPGFTVDRARAGPCSIEYFGQAAGAWSLPRSIRQEHGSDTTSQEYACTSAMFILAAGVLPVVIVCHWAAVWPAT